MVKHTLSFLFILYWLQDKGHGADVTQTEMIWTKEGDDATLSCDHNKGASYAQMYWYRQLPGQTMRLVVYTFYGKDDHDFGDFSKEKYSAHRPSAERGTFTVKSATASDKAMYFCAVSELGYSATEAYFGEGTKLTVLEKDHDVTPPIVKIFEPSEKERPRKKGDPKFKTLVCVARGFYPDHVEVSWKVNGEPIKKGVSTDSIAQRIGKNYTISSRLLVDAAEWTNLGNHFLCLVSFYDGESKKDYSDEAWSIQGGNNEEEDGLSRERYLRITQNAKLSYVVLIVKSAVYGLFVAFLVWKIQRTTVKHP